MGGLQVKKGEFQASQGRMMSPLWDPYYRDSNVFLQWAGLLHTRGSAVSQGPRKEFLVGQFQCFLL